VTSIGPDDPMERIRAVFDQPFPSLPIPPGTWERIETESRRRRRNVRLRTVASVAASLLVVGAGAGLLWPRSDGPVGPGGPDPSTSSAAPTVPSPAPSPSSSASSSPTAPSGAPASTGAVADGLPRGGTVPKGFQPSSLSAASGKAGRYLYLLGDAPDCGNPVCTSMVRSQDDGRTWVGIHAPEAGVGGDTPDAVREIRFATAMDGYAYGPTLFETHDGGDTWTRRNLSSQVLDLAVAGNRVWVVLARCDGVSCTSPRLMSGDVGGGPLSTEAGVTLPSPVSLARLGDGGGTLSLMVGGGKSTAVWRLAPGGRWREGNPRPCDAVVDVPSRLGAVTPAADGSGLLAAGCLGTGGGGATLATVVTSTDGGTSWRQAGTPVQVPDANLWLAVPDGRHLVLRGIPFDGSTPFDRSSADGGRSWAEPAGEVPPDGFRWIGAGGGRLVYGLRVTDGLLYTSTDGGARFGSTPIR
jgi:hypothetical protein